MSDEIRSMRLELVIPGRVVLDLPAITTLVVPTSQGSHGIRPRRLDCVMAIVPGLASYELPDGKRVVFAVDEGILVKAGQQVTCTVRHAVLAGETADLKRTFEAELQAASKREREVRHALARLESSFIRRLSETGRA